MSDAVPKKLEFILSAYHELAVMPEEVQDSIGYALDLAQRGETHHNAKAMKGFKGADVMQHTARYNTDTYRCYYTARFGNVIYVLHCFMKKSKTGVAMTQQEKDLVAARFKEAERLHRER